MPLKSIKLAAVVKYLVPIHPCAHIISKIYMKKARDIKSVCCGTRPLFLQYACMRGNN